MKISESTPTKLFLGSAAASLAALGIVFVASNVTVPAATVVDEPAYTCRMPIANPPPPAPAPTPIDAPRPLAATSK